LLSGTLSADAAAKLKDRDGKSMDEFAEKPASMEIFRM